MIGGFSAVKNHEAFSRHAGFVIFSPRQATEIGFCPAASVERKKSFRRSSRDNSLLRGLDLIGNLRLVLADHLPHLAQTHVEQLALNPSIVLAALALRSEGNSIRVIAMKLGVGAATLHSALQTHAR